MLQFPNLGKRLFLASVIPQTYNLVLLQIERNEMPKTENGRLAIAALKQAGIEVNEDWDDAVTEYGATQFAIANKCCDGWHRYFDMTGDWIKESVVNGEVINRSGVRHSIVEILDEFGLEFDFHDRGTMEVFDFKEEHRTPPWTVASDPKDRPMSQKAFAAFKELARLGMPVWDFDSYSNAYDPASLPSGTQFVMTCEPELDRIFADHSSDFDMEFPETDGLCPDVYEVISKLGLEHCSHTHFFDDKKFRPQNLVAFSDPAATTEERGVIPLKSSSLGEPK